MFPAEVRQAARSLRASPAFSLSVIAILALGIGAGTATFFPSSTKSSWSRCRIPIPTSGIAIGLPAALALTRVMDSLIFGIRKWDPFVCGVVAVLLAVAGLAAAWLPSLRATRVDPADALRSGR